MCQKVADACRRTPGVTAVLDHFGSGGGIAADMDREAWRADMRELAACPNVVVKKMMIMMIMMIIMFMMMVMIMMMMIMMMIMIMIMMMTMMMIMMIMMMASKLDVSGVDDEDCVLHICFAGGF